MPPKINWTPAMQAAWENFLRLREVKGAYGARPLPPEAQPYAPPRIYANSATGEAHFASPCAEAIFIALAPPEQVAAFESYARADMRDWKTAIQAARPATRFQNVKVNL